MYFILLQKNEKKILRCDIRRRSTGLINTQTWTKDKGGCADEIGYTGQDERLLTVLPKSRLHLMDDIIYFLYSNYWRICWYA